jgi:hypothetical protein
MAQRGGHVYMLPVATHGRLPTMATIDVLAPQPAHGARSTVSPAAVRP